MLGACKHVNCLKPPAERFVDGAQMPERYQANPVVWKVLWPASAWQWVQWRSIAMRTQGTGWRETQGWRCTSASLVFQNPFLGQIHYHTLSLQIGTQRCWIALFLLTLFGRKKISASYMVSFHCLYQSSGERFLLVTLPIPLSLLSHVMCKPKVRTGLQAVCISFLKTVFVYAFPAVVWSSSSKM